MKMGEPELLGAQGCVEVLMGLRNGLWKREEDRESVERRERTSGGMVRE